MYNDGVYRPKQCMLLLAIASIADLSAFSPLHRQAQRVAHNGSTRLYDATIGKSESTSYSDSELCTLSFTDLYKSRIPDWLLERCQECGWDRPTRIQKEALDGILLSTKQHSDDNIPLHDVIVQAETGSGKTLAYLLPALMHIDASRSAVQSMIVVPTRELGLQVARVAKKLAAGYRDVNNTNNDKLLVMSVLQGSTNKRQRAWAWAEPPHLVIGTPVELCNMVKFGGIKRYNSVKYLVVDEVDACLLNNSGGYNLQSSPLHELLSKYLSPTFTDAAESAKQDSEAAAVEESLMPSIASKARPLSLSRQTVFASATIPQHRHFIKQCVQNQWMLREPLHICLRPGEQLLPQTLDHAYIVCRDTYQKLPAMVRILRKLLASAKEQQESKKVLVFVDNNRSIDEMATLLSQQVSNCLLWQESSSLDDAESAESILSVLRYEDSLSRRASAVDAFRGDGYSFSNKREISYSSSTQQPVMLRILISTDLAARGLDIMGITHIMHFDLPADADTYVHRSGRSGRLGRSGQVISYITSDQEFVLQRLMNKLSLDVKCIARQSTK